MKNITIGIREIGENSKIFLIAEAGVNHNGDINLAKDLVTIAAEAKVDAIKFQTFISDELLLKTTKKAEYQRTSTNEDENFYEMIKKYEFTKEQFRIIKSYCDNKGIIFLSTPFDPISVEWLEELEIPAYKIGSGDLNNLPLLKLICTKKKPILLSTGMATLTEKKESIKFIKSNGIDEIILFQCTSNYPTPLEQINLNVIDTYKKVFPDVLLGFSDHSLGIIASIGAAAKGVKVIEKHFTLDKKMKGPDHKASLSPEELKNWVENIRNLEKTLGSSNKKPTKTELEIAKIARKSVVTIKNLKKGDILTKENLSIKRPGYGITPVDFEKIIGKKVNKDIPKDSLIIWEDIE